MAAPGAEAAATAGTGGKHIVTQVDDLAGDVFPGSDLGDDCAKPQVYENSADVFVGGWYMWKLIELFDVILQ